MNAKKFVNRLSAAAIVVILTTTLIIGVMDYADEVENVYLFKVALSMLQVFFATVGIFVAYMVGVGISKSGKDEGQKNAIFWAVITGRVLLVITNTLSDSIVRMITAP